MLHEVPDFVFSTRESTHDCCGGATRQLPHVDFTTAAVLLKR